MDFNEVAFKQFIEGETTEEKLEKWKNQYENNELTFSNVGYKISFLNSLGLKYSELLQIKVASLDEDEQAQAVNIFCRNKKELYYPAYFYKCALHVYREECPLSYEYEYDFIKQILVNLGNEYANQYRLLEALSCYQQAIDMDPSFDMALLNRAMVKQKMSMMQYYCDMDCFFNELTADLFAVDKEQLHSGQDYFEYISERYQELEKEFFTQNPDFNSKEFHLMDQIGDDYTKWVLFNELFLNPLNSIDYFEEACCDSLIGCMIPNNILALLKELFDYYCFLRNKLFSISNRDDEYAKRECIEIFKSAYSVFDKIAYVIVKVFNLNIEEERISFTSIWTEELFSIKNVYLYDLYWLQQEYRPRKKLKGNDIDINILLASPFQEFVELRNRLEHRVESVNNFKATYLYEKTLAIMKVTRIALLNLNWLIFEEQNPSLKNADGTRNKDLFVLPEIEW